MIQQQRFGGSTLGTPARIVQEYGAAAIGRGITTTIGREAMFTMSMLGITPLIQEKLVASSGMEKNAALAAGSLTGALLAGVAVSTYAKQQRKRRPRAQGYTPVRQ